MRRPLLLLPVAALLATGLLTGCSGSSSGSASSDAASSAGGAGPAAGAARPAPVGQPAAAPVVATGTVAVPRSLVRTAAVTLAVRDVAAAARGVVALGTVEHEDVAADQGTVVLQVDPDGVPGVLDRVARLGEERSRVVGVSDVTDQVVDLTSRLATQRASVARVRALLDRADAVRDVVSVEGELSKREAELESLESRVAAVQGQVERATVTVTLQRQGSPAAAASRAGFSDGLRGGWHAVTATARVLAVTLGALLPFSPLLLLALLSPGVRGRLRRRAV